ncbi:SDR family NAD(P)-dependent oxidoreductase [Erwinia amylovora]
MTDLIIITGSNGGIGRELVDYYLGCQKRVIGIDTDNRLEHPDYRFIAVDLNDPAALQSMDFNAFDPGDYSVLINAAGIREITPLLELSLETWLEVMQVNLTAPFVLSQKFCRTLLASGKQGSIVNIASVSGMLGEPARTAYVSSKHGLLGLTKQFAVEFGRSGIRCNAISPAITRTPMTEHYFSDEATLQKINSGLYSTRTGQPADIASVVRLLAAQDSVFINGANFVVDGGWTCGKDL